jgi:hypothetical protein
MILQVLSLRKSMHESHALIEAAHAMAERAKRFLISFLGVFFAAIFLFSGFLVAVIELGLQIDRDGHISFSGLMISATILFAFGFVLTLFSLLLAVAHPPPPKKPVEREPSREDKIKELIEEFLVVFLTQLATKRNAPSDPEKPTA